MRSSRKANNNLSKRKQQSQRSYSTLQTHLSSENCVDGLTPRNHQSRPKVYSTSNPANQQHNPQIAHQKQFRSKFTTHHVNSLFTASHRHISTVSHHSTSQLFNASNQSQLPPTSFHAPALLRYQVRRFASLPAGDYSPSLSNKPHPAVNPDYVDKKKVSVDPKNPQNLLSGSATSQILIGADLSGAISSAAFGSVEITDTMIKMGDQVVHKIGNAAMSNIDADLIPFTTKKGWLPARFAEDKLPFGLTPADQEKIRDFQAKLPTPIHSDTSSILALPPSRGGFGFDQLTFIQGKLLPMIAMGLDILLRSPTSSGKTLAYAVPLIERLLYLRHPSNSRDIPILVIVPSRELALQTTATIQHLLSLHHKTESRRYGVFPLVGGSVQRVEQEPLMRADIGFLVATTGRLLHHIKETPGFEARLKECKVVVMDEVDYLLAQTGGTDVGEILNAIHPQRQTIMLSATLTPAVRKVATFALRKGAALVDVVKDSIVSLGTGISTTLTGDSKPMDTNNDPLNANAEELKESQSTEIGAFAADDHELFSKRQQNLVGIFVNEQGETVHIDHTEVVDKLGKNELVYEKQSFKRLAEQEEAKHTALEDASDGGEVIEYEVSIETDPDTGTKTLKKVPKTKSRPLSDTQDHSGIILSKNDHGVLYGAGFGEIDPNETTTSHKRTQNIEIKRHHDQRSTFDQYVAGTDRDAEDVGKTPSKLRKTTDSTTHDKSSQRVLDISGLPKFQNEKLGEGQVSSDTFEGQNTKKRTKDEIGDQMDAQSSLDSLEMAPLDDVTRESFKQHLDSARKQLNHVDVGKVSQLLKRNEAIVDDLAIYSDGEDGDDDVVLFDEVNANVQHYVQAASTAEAMMITARLLDDIGGRFMFAKQQVKQHNDRLNHDESYRGVELEAPKPPKVMIFCETSRYAQFFTALLRNVIDLSKDSAYEAILELHGKKGQNFRTRIASQFATQNWNSGCILFASDVAARGLDTKDVDCVIQIGLPPSRQQWIHRIGRVARSGDSQGISLTLVCPEHAASFSRMTSGLPIHVPKVGSLGLGLRQDNFNNSELDPAQNKTLTYKPTVPSAFGEVGEYFDEEAGDISGQLRSLLIAKREAQKALESKQRNPLLSASELPSSLQQDKHLDYLDERDPSSVPFQGKMSKTDRRHKDFDPVDPDGTGSYKYGEDLEDAEAEDIEEEIEEEDPETQEQTLWHGTIERAVSTAYINRIKDDSDRQERLNRLNDISMSANTGSLASEELYARYDYIMKKQLTRNILRNEEMRLHAERAYVAYLGHHITLFHRSRGVEERLKSVKMSKSPFKNKDQICKLAYDFAKAIGLCGPNGDLPPPAISQATAQRLGLTAAQVQSGVLNIGTPTQFSHHVELQKKEEEKRQIEQQKADHRVRRRYWETKQLAIQQGKPIPQPPKELLEQRQRIKLQTEANAIARAERQIERQKNKVLQKYGMFTHPDEDSTPPTPSFNPSTPDIVQNDQNNGELPTQSFNSAPYNPQKHRAMHNDPEKRHTTNLVAFSDDETDPILHQTVRKLGRSQAMHVLHQGSSDPSELENIFVEEGKFADKVSKYFPSTKHQERTRQQQLEEEQLKQKQQEAKAHQPYKNVSSKFFEEHQEWLRQEEHRKARRERDLMANEEIARKEKEAQSKYKKAFKKREDRDKKAPAPGRELMSQTALFNKEPRRIRTGELDHKVHKDIVF